MPKLTMKDVDKQIEDWLTPVKPVERTGVIQSLLQRVRGVPGLPKEPPLEMPPLETPELLREPRLPRRV